MAQHFKSSCKQCYRYDICVKEEKTHLKDERIVKDKDNKNRPFAFYVLSERKAFQKKLMTEDKSTNIVDNDCFKSIQQREKELANQKNKKQKG